MSVIEIYAEFYYGKRLPNLEYFLNSQKIETTESLLIESLTYKDNYKIKLEADTQEQNLFEIKMSDKTDNDLLYDYNSSKWIDHYVQIKEMSLDGITFETALNHCCEFRHTMGEEWVKKMKEDQNIEIMSCYKGSTEIRLNGIWNIKFKQPIWKWQIENRYE